jgi:hypothetical protein
MDQMQYSLISRYKAGCIGHAMAKAVSHRPLTAEARVCTRVSPCGVCGGQSDTGTGFSPCSLFSLPVSFHHIDQKMAAVHGMFYIIPPHNGNDHSTMTVYLLGVNNRPFGGCSLEG